jgi:hypothetical protein
MTATKPATQAAQWATVLCAWMALLVVFFHPVFFGGKVLAPLDILESLLKPWATAEKVEVHNAFPYDAISQYLPYNWAVYQSIREDGYIGWNPYAHNGTSILENTMLCPGDWHHQLYRVLSFWDAWNLGIILQFFLAGLGMLVLLRLLAIPPAIALAGVIGYGFYSQFVTWYCHRWVLGAMCWAPWMVWAFLRAFGRHRWVDPLACVFTALAFRGGHLQTCLFVVLTTALVFFADMAEHRHDKRLIRRRIGLLSTTALLSSLLTLDVWWHVIPAYLQGCPPRPFVGWLDSAKQLPTLAAALLPTIFGTPDGIDAMKAFGGDLFNIIFLGAPLVLLGGVGLFKRSAPLTAKVLFCAGLLLPFTPASTWLYLRCTPIFALGCVWLGCVVLKTSLEARYQRNFWRTTFLLFGLAVLAWLAASIALALLRPTLEPVLVSHVTKSLSADKALRAEWMKQRVVVFLDRSFLWHPANLRTLLVMGAGLFSASRIHAGNRRATAFAALLAVLTFAELFFYSRTWLTFSDRPLRRDDLYNTPPWVAAVKHHAGNGSVCLYDRAVFDYMQLNTASSHGIRFQDGYDTVMPPQCRPLDYTSRAPESFADAGVSLFLVHPAVGANDLREKGWILVHNSDDFVLYRNPAFDSRVRARTAEGKTIPVVIEQETPNMRRFVVPPTTAFIEIGETYHAGWRAVMGKAVLSATRSANGGMRIALPAATETAQSIQLRFRPTLF